MAAPPTATWKPQAGGTPPRMKRGEKDRQLRRNNPMAYTGIVLALFGFIFNPFAIPSILGIIFSSIGLSKSFALVSLGHRITGQGIAITGLILGILGTVVFAFGFAQALS